MNSYASNMKFANDIVHFVMAYFNIPWEQPISNTGRRTPIIRFTTEHAKVIKMHLANLDVGLLSTQFQYITSMNETKFLTLALWMQTIFKRTAYSTHNFLYFCCLISKLAAVSVSCGLPDAPVIAVRVIFSTATALCISRNLYTSSFAKDSSSRSIL